MLQFEVFKAVEKVWFPHCLIFYHEVLVLGCFYPLSPLVRIFKFFRYEKLFDDLLWSSFWLRWFDRQFDICPAYSPLITLSVIHSAPEIQTKRRANSDINKLQDAPSDLLA